MPPNEKGALTRSVPRCAMGSLIVKWQERQSSPQKSRVVGPGDPGARGGPAATRVGLGCRAGAATVPRPGSWCCSSALAPEHLTQACFTAACPGEELGAREGSGVGGAQRDWVRKATELLPRPHGALPVGPSSQWAVSGPLGLPGPCALSHAGAP